MTLIVKMGFLNAPIVIRNELEICGDVTFALVTPNTYGFQALDIILETMQDALYDEMCAGQYHQKVSGTRNLFSYQCSGHGLLSNA